MVVRTWTTGVAAGREDEYEHFAQERSLPMFSEQDGCLGVLFTRPDGGRPDERVVVVTFWQDADAVDRLARPPGYGRPGSDTWLFGSLSRAGRWTVAALEGTGILTGRQRVDVLEVTGGFLEAALLQAVSR